MTDHTVDANKLVRAEFEAFVLQETGINLRANVEAMTPGIGLAWRAWQAATQRQQERIAELEAQVQALSVDAARYQFATAYNDEGRLNFKAVYDAWDGDGSFTDQIDAARATHKEQA